MGSDRMSSIEMAATGTPPGPRMSALLNAVDDLIREAEARAEERVRAKVATQAQVTILTCGQYSDCDILGVFRTEEEARTACEAVWRNDVVYELHTLDIGAMHDGLFHDIPTTAHGNPAYGWRSDDETIA